MSTLKNELSGIGAAFKAPLLLVVGIIRILLITSRSSASYRRAVMIMGMWAFVLLPIVGYLFGPYEPASRIAYLICFFVTGPANFWALYGENVWSGWSWKKVGWLALCLSSGMMGVMMHAGFRISVVAERQEQEARRRIAECQPVA